MDAIDALTAYKESVDILTKQNALLAIKAVDLLDSPKVTESVTKEG